MSVHAARKLLAQPRRRSGGGPAVPRRCCDVLPRWCCDCLAGFWGRVRRLERIVEQIGAVPVPQIWEPIGEVVQLSPRERVQNRTLEQVMDSSMLPIMEVSLPFVPHQRVQNRTPDQIVGIPVPQISEDSLPFVPQERVQNRTTEQIVDFPVPQIIEAPVEVVLSPPQDVDILVPQIMEDSLPALPQERVQNRTPEQIVDILVPQIMEDSLPALPQERVQNRTLEQVFVFPVPQTMEAVVEVSPPTQQERVLCRIQERVQNRPRKLFVDVPVPHIMEQTAGKVMRTGKVFTVDMRHHRGDQGLPSGHSGLEHQGSRQVQHASSWRCHGARTSHGGAFAP